MKKIIILFMLAINSIFLVAGNIDITKIAKDYPYKNSPIMATVLGTPSSQYYKLKNPVSPKVRKFQSNKRIPLILMPWSTYDYGLWVQEKKSPLMILISGTGSVYSSGLTMYMANVFYDKGYNVIAFSSPTTMPYIVSQSQNNYGGYIKDESRHLYDLIIEAIQRAKIKDNMKIGDIYIGGYSLGGFQSLLTHEIDSKEKKIGIKKSLILNSPVSILTATQILDDFLIKNGIYNAKGLERYLDSKFSKIMRDKNIKLNDINFSNLMEGLIKLGIEEKDFEILTGLLFRFYSANMTFAGEVFSGENSTGRLSEKIKYNRFDSLKNEFLEGLSVSFEEYSTEILYPSIKEKYPDITFEEFVKEFSLKKSEDFIEKNNKNIVFITSEDDVLITEDDKEYIKRTFKNKILLPFGGHTGILWHRDVANLMIQKLEENNEKK